MTENPSDRWRAPKKAAYASVVEAIKDLSIKFPTFRVLLEEEVRWLLPHQNGIASFSQTREESDASTLGIRVQPPQPARTFPSRPPYLSDRELQVQKLLLDSNVMAPSCQTPEPSDAYVPRVQPPRTTVATARITPLRLPAPHSTSATSISRIRTQQRTCPPKPHESIL